jgi:predicted esterase
VDFQGSVYYVTTPATYTADKAWPVIFGLHGDEGDPAKSVNSLWRRVVDGNFIFIAPKAANEGGSWYEARESNAKWMDALLESVLAGYNVDLDRIGIWGLSGGAVFISTYALERQHVFSAIEFNMGGSGRRYIKPTRPDCKAPVRFVVSADDFLRDGALGLYNLLKENGHDATWVDASCSGHCFDQEQAGPVARDFLLSHTLCGATPSSECRSGAGGSTGVGGAATAGTGGRAGSNTSSSGGVAAVGGTGSQIAGSTGNASAGRPSSSAGGMGGSANSSAAAGTNQAASETDAEEGCSCGIPTRANTKSWLASLFVVALATRRRIAKRAYARVRA